MRSGTPSQFPRTALRPGAFTFVELCIAMVITALVMSAISSFVLAMSHSWRHHEQSDSLSLYARQAAGRVNRIVLEAKLIGTAYSPSGGFSSSTPPAVILWIEDTNGDGLIQGAECGMLEHDPQTNSLVYYYPGQGDAVLPLTWDVFTSGAVLTNFRIGRESRPIARNVRSITFRGHHQDSETVCPTLEYRLEVGHSDRTVIEYGTASVRAPARKPL